jgi:polysaccharide export outer membrane protein
LNGCATYPDWLASQGPSREQVVYPEAAEQLLLFLDVTNEVALRLSEADERPLFSVALPNQVSPEHVVGPGDVLEVIV